MPLASPTGRSTGSSSSSRPPAISRAGGTGAATAMRSRAGCPCPTAWLGTRRSATSCAFSPRAHRAVPRPRRDQGGPRASRGAACGWDPRRLRASRPRVGREMDGVDARACGRPGGDDRRCGAVAAGLAGRPQRGVAPLRARRRGTVRRDQLYRVASVGYLGNIVNGELGFAIRVAALRRVAPERTPKLGALAVTEVPIVLVEAALAALVTFTLVGPLGLPWWLPIACLAVM